MRNAPQQASWDSSTMMHIDTQTINTSESLRLYGDIVETVPGLLLQWVVTWALPEIYEELIKRRKEKGLPTFVISSWYHDRWEVKFWNYESIVRNKDTGAIYLDWVNLNDIREIFEFMHWCIWEWKQGIDLEIAMREKFCKSEDDDSTNTAVVDIL